MRHTEIQRSKLARLIAAQGESYTFYRESLNEYKEPSGALTKVARVEGIWHESQGYVTVTNEEAARVRSKPAPQILILYAETGIQQGDFTTVKGKTFTVTGVHDPTNLGVALDISLEGTV